MRLSTDVFVTIVKKPTALSTLIYSPLWETTKTTHWRHTTSYSGEPSATFLEPYSTSQWPRSLQRGRRWNRDKSELGRGCWQSRFLNKQWTPRQAALKLNDVVWLLEASPNEKSGQWDDSHWLLPAWLYCYVAISYEVRDVLGNSNRSAIELMHV